MRNILLLLFVIFFTYAAKASDTLTVRQVFNFNVGDTFDYKMTTTYNSGCAYCGLNTHGYSRFVITNIDTSISGDTIIYYRIRLYPQLKADTIYISKLDSPFTVLFANYDTFLFSSDTLADGRKENEISTPPFEGSAIYKLGTGLGLVKYTRSNGDPGNWTLMYDSSLVYYSKGPDTMGIPYYNQPDYYPLPHYTPIPEQCASWVRKYIDTPVGSSNFYEEIKTGNKVSFNNHQYVELYYNYYDVIMGTLDTNSLIGYFRNDTLGQKVYFASSMSSPDELLYDFSLASGQPFDGIISSCCGFPAFNFNFGVSLYEVPVNGTNRIEWDYYEYATPPLGRGRGYIEGIGGLQGFVLVNQGDDPYYAGELISFCVCGQSIYPNSDPANCFDINGIVQISQQNKVVQISPNPTNGLLHISLNTLSQNYQFILSDLLGKELLSQPISQNETTLDISNLAGGLYTWRLMSDNGIIKTGKIIKE